MGERTGFPQLNHAADLRALALATPQLARVQERRGTRADGMEILIVILALSRTLPLHYCRPWPAITCHGASRLRMMREAVGHKRLEGPGPRFPVIPTT